jgi:hypothetical protein
MRGLFRVLTPAQIRGVLTNAYAALRPGSPLYVVGWILDDSKASPLSYATYNLLFVNDYASGVIHTEAEHRAWLEEAGFAFDRRQRAVPTTLPISSWLEGVTQTSAQTHSKDSRPPSLEPRPPSEPPRFIVGFTKGVETSAAPFV